jgi:prophage regulatory protein
MEITLPARTVGIGAEPPNSAPFTGLEPLLSINKVTALTSLSKATVYRLVNTGDFPAPLKIGKARVAWRASAIGLWMSERVRAA